MASRDTRKPGPIANFVFGAMWLSLGILLFSTPGLPVVRWVQLVLFLLMAATFLRRGIRLLRDRRSDN